MTRRRVLAIAIVAAATVAAIPGCGTSTGVRAGERVTVYVSAPLHGPDAAQGRQAIRGARAALAHADGRAGDLRVRAVYLDDTMNGAVSPVRVAANARRATEDTTAVAYVGELTPAAAAISGQVAKEAELLHVSPAGGAEMSGVLDAIRAAGSSGDQRQAVRDAYSAG